MTRKSFDHPHRDAVDARIAECVTALRATPGFACFPDVRRYFYTGSSAAGTAHCGQDMIGLHATLLTENLQSMLRETVPHEIAHLAAFWYWQQDIYMRRCPKGHGREWQRIMRGVFGVEPERTHNYSMANVKVRRQARWAFGCGCPGRVHNVPTVRKNKYLSRPGMFICRRCRTPLTFIGQLVERSQA